MSWRWKLANVSNDRSVLPEYANDFDDSGWTVQKSGDGLNIEKRKHHGDLPRACRAD